MKRFLAILGLGLAFEAISQEVVTLQTRPGVTQSFFIASMDGKAPEAVALLFSGGGGNIRLRIESGRPQFASGNFLPRSRREFIRNAILPVILDNPSDQQSGDGMSDEFRASLSHVMDVRAVMAEMRKRRPGLPIFLVGTSRSTISVAHLALALDGESAGAVLSSTLFYTGGRNPRPILVSFKWQRIKTPVLFVHHEDDGCVATPYIEAGRLGRQFPLVTVRGGKAPESGPCDPLSPHGFFGKEVETVDAIAAWMLKGPFQKEIR